MLRTKLSDRKLPNYTHGEELFNMISHIVGGACGIAALVLCVIVSALHHNIYGVVGSAVYGFTMILLYCMSSIYHGLSAGTAKKVFQVLDHCTIYLLIAGTYTPLTLSAMRLTNPALGWTLFGIEWALAALAVTLTAIDLKKYNVFSMTCYIVTGCLIIPFAKQAVAALTLRGFALIVLGGVFYLTGAVLYGIGKKKKYAHNAFHVFVLLGSLLHFFSILFYAL